MILGFKTLFPLPITFMADDPPAGGGGPTDTDPPVDTDPPADPPADDSSDDEPGEKDAAYWEAEAKKAIEKREKVKKELLEAKGKLQEIEDGELIAKGKHEEVIAGLKAQVSELTTKLDGAEAAQAEIEKIKANERKELLSQLSDDDKKFAKDKITNLEDLREYVKLHKVEKGDTDNSRGGGKQDPKGNGSLDSYIDSVYKK